MDQKKIGKFLSELRRKENLTQEALGEKIGVTNKTISRWENGTYMPDIEMFLILSKFYNISVNELLYGEYMSGEDFVEKSDDTIVKMVKDKDKLIKNIIIISAVILLCLCLCFLSVITGIYMHKRYKKLYPENYDDLSISKKFIKEDIEVYDGKTDDPLYTYIEESNDISVDLHLYGYELNDKSKNVFVKEDSYIILRAYYTNEYPLPINAELSNYFSSRAIYRYTDKCLFAMKYNFDEVSIFSSETDIDIASGCKMLIMYSNFSNREEDYGYVHQLTGKWNGFIVSNGSPEDPENVWTIVLEDNYRLLFITVKDNEIGSSTENIAKFLSTVEFNN